ncbi:hypothetical protein [Helicobacter pullorum]|uniref:hypothetical protein n=1 Tax=Helicobacter pullorum TaxID=35818 RepID=UPI00255C51B5|nr:hypothetical protein [Helicobacter pullorum]
MNDNLKCDRFYSKNKNKFATIDECSVESEHILEHYSNDMFCPECRAAELYFVSNTNTPHLRTKRNALHNPNCYYNYKVASNEVVQDFINSLTDKQIQNKLDSIMRYLCSQDKSLIAPQENSANTNPLSIKLPSKQTKRTIRVLKRKSLNSLFSLEDTDNLYAFYGKVVLNMFVGYKEDKKFAYVKLSINDKIRFQINVSKNIPNDIDNGKMYDIVIIGNINKPKQDEIFSPPFKIKLLKPSCLKYVKHKEC